MNALAKVALCPSRKILRIGKASISNLTLSALLGWYEIQMKILWHYFHIEKVVSERHFTKWNCTNFSHFWEWKTYWSLASWLVTQYNASNPLGQTGEELTPLEYRSLLALHLRVFAPFDWPAAVWLCFVDCEASLIFLLSHGDREHVSPPQSLLLFAINLHNFTFSPAALNKEGRPLVVYVFWDHRGLYVSFPQFSVGISYVFKVHMSITN